ncbi:VMAP-C domain-containing protein [Streptomyces anandii]|uniref:VMAP-C domain-containing protein n=1 Tax=Streptomyces anandii TaxID=285454 RepID=UPI0027E3BD49|nr:hypothetical protein [Streptomyces anandii]
MALARSGRRVDSHVGNAACRNARAAGPAGSQGGAVMGATSANGPLAAFVARNLLRQMADVLNRSPRFATPSSRQDLVSYLVRALEQPFTAREKAPARSFDHFTHIVTECALHSEGTDALAEAVASLDGDRRTALEMRQLSDKWTAREQLDEEEMLFLDQLLGQVGAEHDVQAIALASLQPVPAPLPEHCTDARSVLLYLLRRNALPDGLPPFLAFLEFLAASTGEPLASPLREWTERRARGRELWPALEACRARADGTRVTAARERRMMLVLLPDGLDDDYYALRVWHQDDAPHPAPALRDNDARVREADLERAIRGKVREASQGHDKGAALTVEFWLPLSLINLPVAEWCAPREPGAPDDVRVVVRSLDRVRASGSLRSWRERWSRMVDTSEGAGAGADAGTDRGADAAFPVRLDRERDPDRQRERGRARGLEWNPDRSRGGGSPEPTEFPEWPEPRPNLPLVLSAPPDCAEGRDQLLRAITIGVPVVLWHRHDCTSREFRDTVDVLLSHGPVSTLPERIRAMRLACEAGGLPTEVVRGLTLMWDDPNRSLPVLSPLVAPDEVASPPLFHPHGATGDTVSGPSARLPHRTR